MVGVGEMWETLKQAIAAYTGLSPAALFTAVAVAAALYHVAAGLLQGPPPPPPRRREAGSEAEDAAEPLPPPVELGEVTEEELRAFDGSDSKKPLLMAIKGQIYDVSQSRMFYGPGGPYALFAGRDASRALAKMSFEQKDLTGDISGLGPFELEALQDWEYKFMSKYVKVGTIKKSVPVTDADPSNPSEPSEKGADVSPSDCQANDAAETWENGPASSEDKDQKAGEAENGPRDLVEEAEYTNTGSKEGEVKDAGVDEVPKE
ncbi:Membrane steroid-binding protein 2 [Ananas comosus]|uniref:Membrane steroid-binding protein 2 n=1 Tax=Ananas comosus TaxID=4615 RepID=A0A199W003_ANACO|nr:Membrane steroid-binding protein 2 [Ananas comosus]